MRRSIVSTMTGVILAASLTPGIPSVTHAKGASPVVLSPILAVTRPLSQPGVARVRLTHPSSAFIVLYVDGTAQGYTGANLRARPSMSASIILLIPNGAAVRVTPQPIREADKSAWYSATYNGRQGYVLASLLRAQSPSARSTTIATRAAAISQTASYRGVSFVYDRALATSARGQLVPPYQDSGYPYPASLQITLAGYPLPIPNYDMPQITVYNVADLVRTMPVIGSRDITTLRALLQRRPDLSTVPYLPGLPVLSNPILHAKGSYVSFHNGTGIRYIGYWANAMGAIAPDSIYYTFQGLTNDGQDYVCALLPADASVLHHAPTLLTRKQYNDFDAHYGAYIAAMTQRLNDLPDARYLPHLGTMDDLVTSLTVHPSLGTASTLSFYVKSTAGTTGANLRAAPSLQAPILLIIPNGTEVQASASPVRGSNGQLWYKVSYQGAAGYVLASLLSRVGVAP